MNRSDRATAALLALFPTHKNFRRFANNPENNQALASLVALAYRNKLIPHDTSDALSEFIREKAGSMEAVQPDDHLRFEDLLEQKQTLLELNLSARALADRINGLIAEQRIDLPKLSNSMFSRLKKEAADTSHKQNVLRSLAFWIGYDRSHLVARWNFDTLLALCREGKHAVEHKEGVRIGFALYSRGDVIDHDIVGWLKRELKSYIDTSLDRFSYGRWGKVRSHDITTLYVDFPKEQTANNLAAYRQCLRSAVSLAHQMAIRWPLSTHHSRNRFMSIGIAAGEFTTLDTYLVPILNAKLPGDPTIRLTDYAQQCVIINDIRALMCDQPVEIPLLNGETLPVWWVKGFWSTLYFDFIPKLLEDPMLGADDQALFRLIDKLWPSIIIPKGSKADMDGTDAISTLFRTPNNALLGLEIAKTLYYRRRFREALEILKIVLSLNPYQLSARTLRMGLWRNMAIEAPSYNIARGLFGQACQEAEYIQKRCNADSEDFYCESGALSLTQAMITLLYMRAGKGVIAGMGNSDQLTQHVFDWLDQAETLFSKGLLVSPTGFRAAYLLNSARLLKVVLTSDPRLFAEADRPLDGPQDLITETNREHLWLLGIIREDVPVNPTQSIMEKIFLFTSSSHDDAISLQAYRPTTYFCTAVSWWDRFPERTVACAKHTLRVLHEAAAMAREIGKKEVCIYSFTRTFGEMMPVPEFIAHINRCIDMVKSQAGENLNRRSDHEIIPCAENGKRKSMMTLNF